MSQSLDFMELDICVFCAGVVMVIPREGETKWRARLIFVFCWAVFQD